MIRLIIVLFILSFSFWAAGQSNEWSEDQIKIQTHIADASAHKLQGNVDKAIEEYQKAIKINTNVPVAWYEIARLEHAQGNNEEALQSVNKAINLDSENRWFVLFKIDLLSKMYRGDEAIVTMRDFISTNGEEQRLLEQLAFMQSTARQPQQAIATFSLLEDNYGIREDWTRKKYNLLLELDKKKEALAEIENLSKIYPSNTDYLLLIAEHHNYNGDKNAAEEMYNQILAIDPAHPKANLAMAQTNVKDDNQAGFIQNIQPILEDSRVDIDVKMREVIPALEKLSQNYIQGLSQDLLLASRTILASHPEEAKAHALRADVLNASGRYGEAVDSYGETVKRQKNVLAVWEQYIEVLELLRRDKELSKVVNDALDVFPNQGILAYYDGLAQVRNSAKKDDAVSLRRAQLLNKKDPTRLAFIELLQVEQAIQKGEFNKNMVSEFFSENGNNDLVLGRLIAAFWKENDVDNAMYYSDKSKSVWNALALSKSDTDKALELLKPSVDLPASPPILKDLYLYLQSVGNLELDSEILGQLKEWKYDFLFYSEYE